MRAAELVETAVKAARAEPRKASLVVALLAVMGVLCARAMVEGVPGQAEGAATGVTGVDARIDTTPTTGPAIDPLREWARGPVAPLSRNLFYINLDHYPQERGRESAAAAPAAASEAEGGGIRGPLAKSRTGPAEEQDRRQQLAEGLRSEASRLHLQSILMGPTPKALVDGQLVGEGDVVAKFRVAKIEARGVTLEREGVRLEVSFK